MHLGGSFGVKKKGAHPRIGDAKAPIGLWAGIHLGKKLYTHAGEVLAQVTCGKRNKIIGQS